MLIHLKVAQFGSAMRLAGKSFNKIIDPDLRDKGVEILASDLGVIVRLGVSEVLVPWSNVEHVEAVDGSSFLKPSEAPGPPPQNTEQPPVAPEPPPAAQYAPTPSSIFKRGPGRPKKSQ